MPLKATKKKKNTTETTAKDGDDGAKKTLKNPVRRSERLMVKRNSCNETQIGAGTSQSQDLLDVLRLLLHPIPVQQTPVDIEEPDPRSTCLICSSLLKPVLDEAGQMLPLLQCQQCPDTQFLCKQCLYPCLYSSDKGISACTNNSCHLVATLLSCDLVKDLKSRVYGCPLFRACPKCHSLTMHERGCKYVACAQCKHIYCFICLQRKKECVKDIDKYWSLTCSKPRAARQRFQT